VECGTAFWWQDRHNEIRARRARETGMWLVCADVTGERDRARIGLGPTCFLNPAGSSTQPVRWSSRFLRGSTGMVTADINQSGQLSAR
jgi:hypothetical protein